jgi:two-component system, sensor histidine kinase and response regulator
MDDYIAKPVQFEELAATLQRRLALADKPPAKQSRNSAPLPPAQDVFDRAACLNRLGGDEELLHRIVTVFVDDAQQQVDKLAEALAAADSAQINRLAHKLNGASGSIGATELQKLASKLEAAARDQIPMAFAESIPSLRQTFKTLKSVLERELTAVAA